MPCGWEGSRCSGVVYPPIRADDMRKGDEQSACNPQPWRAADFTFIYRACESIQSTDMDGQKRSGRGNSRDREREWVENKGRSKQNNGAVLLSLGLSFDTEAPQDHF